MDEATGGAAPTGPQEPVQRTDLPGRNEPDDLTDPVPTSFEPDEPSSLESASLGSASYDSGALDDPLPTRARPTARGLLIAGARVVTGVVAVVVAAVAITVPTVLPDLRYRAEPAAVVVSPVPAAQERLCPGPFLLLGGNSGQAATTASSAGRPSVMYQGAPDEPTVEQLAETENANGLAPVLLTLPPAEGKNGEQMALAGSQSQPVDSAEAVGFAAAECAEAAGDSWLVGGSTVVGRTTVLTISNPSSTIATVEFTIYGEDGEVPAPGTSGIVLPPSSQRVFSLAGFAPDVSAPVVRVQSRGGRVAANLQQSIVRTLEPGGVDVVGSGGIPNTTVSIPGLVISGSEGIAAAQASEGYDDLLTTVRLLSPGENATAVVTVTPDEGNVSEDPGVALENGSSESPGSEGLEVALLAGQVTDVPVPGLTDGSYSVQIESTAPIVAGARVSTAPQGGGSDFAWLAGARPLDGTTLVSVAPGPAPMLRLSNPGNAARAVTFSSSSGGQVVEVPAGGAASAPLEAGRNVVVTGTSGLAGAVTYLGEREIAGFVLSAPGPTSGEITVYR